MKDFLNEIERMFPFLILLYFAYKAVDHGEHKLFIAYILNNASNHILKEYIFKPIMGNKSFPLLGKGTRPVGAKNCKIFSDGTISKSYGMPSGHAQSIAFFLTSELNNNSNYLYKVCLTIISIFMIYSRVNLGCHTIQQVLVGSIIGIMFFYFYNFTLILQ
tara:strand:- start:8 stop:490 length:483 start_codon:yes stop_codon:yes gene_type:complete